MAMTDEQLTGYEQSLKKAADDEASARLSSLGNTEARYGDQSMTNTVNKYNYNRMNEYYNALAQRENLAQTWQQVANQRALTRAQIENMANEHSRGLSALGLQRKQIETQEEQHKRELEERRNEASKQRQHDIFQTGQKQDFARAESSRSRAHDTKQQQQRTAAESVAAQEQRTFAREQAMTQREHDRQQAAIARGYTHEENELGRQLQREQAQANIASQQENLSRQHEHDIRMAEGSNEAARRMQAASLGAAEAQHQASLHQTWETNKEAHDIRKEEIKAAQAQHEERLGQEAKHYESTEERLWNQQRADQERRNRELKLLEDKQREDQRQQLLSQNLQTHQAIYNMKLHTKQMDQQEWLNKSNQLLKALGLHIDKEKVDALRASNQHAPTSGSEEDQLNWLSGLLSRANGGEYDDRAARASQSQAHGAENSNMTRYLNNLSESNRRILTDLSSTVGQYFLS
jgi:hypothetical protein